MAIHESGEDYLEAILMIKKRNGNVRSIDIAHELSFSKPSVSVVNCCTQTVQTVMFCQRVSYFFL